MQSPTVKHKTHVLILIAIPLVPVAYFLIQELTVARALGFSLDDAWIFWVFAKNLANGHGFSFNPGQPVFGSTSILWVSVLACSYLVSHSAVIISKMWGVVFFSLSVFLTYRICLFHVEKEETARWAVVTYALAPPIVIGALCGMEVSLATFLFCLTLFFHLKERNTNQRIFLAPIFGALCFVARPELIVFYPMLLIHEYFIVRRDDVPGRGRTARSSTLTKALTFGALLVASFLFSYIACGSLLPNTLAAKTLDAGFIWAASDANPGEMFISLTLNPFVGAGSILVTLVCLNIFWAFFWSRGLVLSLLERKTLIYPLVFILIPAIRCAVAPVGSSFTAQHRYVSFLFPLLSVFFVIGSQGFDRPAAGRISGRAVRRWLLVLMGVAGIAALFLYSRPLVRKDLLWWIFSANYVPPLSSRPALADMNFCDFLVVLCFAVALIAGISLISSTRFFTRRLSGKKAFYLLVIAGLLVQVAFLNNRAERQALAVKNINELQVRMGKWVNKNIPEGALMATNDIGAIKFFGDRECLDLEGLASPRIVPYKILGKDSYVLFLNRNRPEYFMIFPAWYPLLVRTLGLRENTLYEIRLDENVASGGGGYMIAAKADWALFDSTLQRTGILDLKPRLPRKSFRRRWYEAQERLGLPPDWLVYQRKGKAAERWREWSKAEKYYRKAESYDPQVASLYLEMARFYRSRGDFSQAQEEFQKSIRFRLFPPPDFVLENIE
jgi:hypothetical protein